MKLCLSRKRCWPHLVRLRGSSKVQDQYGGSDQKCCQVNVFGPYLAPVACSQACQAIGTSSQFQHFAQTVSYIAQEVDTLRIRDLSRVLIVQLRFHQICRIREGNCEQRIALQRPL